MARKKKPCSACQLRAERVAALRHRVEQPIESWGAYADCWELLTAAAPEVIAPIGIVYGACTRLSTGHATREPVGLTGADRHLARSLAVRLGLTEQQVLERALAELAAAIEPGGAAA